ncbi:HAD-IA family hydrolase [Kitasatospora saccharophila]|uniref:HAD-IA family hydrolase n=1 Tax=Kitasatospora saccharophila TaxID=407973 RepID=A0ABN2XA17_9ACTN
MELTPGHPPVGPVDTVVFDYGGVLTNPLSETFAAFGRRTGIELADIARAFAAATERHGISPMAELEVAAITEREFTERLLAELPPGSEAALAGRPFGELWFLGRRANDRIVDYARKLKADGYRIALLTNNVAEWGPRWRATLPVEELFDAVVDSSAERVRKPDPELYRRLLTRLGTTAGHCLLVDDTAENCAAAERLGLGAVLFQDDAQAVRDVDALLAAGAGER